MIRTRTVALTTLLAASAGAMGQSNPVPLNANYNGLAHTGEFTGAANPGVADNANGFRSISDRALYVNGAAGSFGTSPITGSTGLSYTIVTQAFVNDLVMLGNRNALWPFDAAPNANNRGIAPSWLPVFDQSAPQTTDLATPVLLSETSQVGVLFQISNSGGSFNVVLTCADGTQATARLAGPDWFGAGNPVPAPNAGVQAQTRLGTFNSAGNFDNPQPSGALNVIEGVIGVSNLLNAGLGDLRGKQLTSITFQDRFDQFGNAIALGSGNRSFAILALTAGGAAAPANDDCANASVITEGTVVTGSTGGAAGIEGGTCNGQDDADVWYRYTASSTGTARVSLCGSGFDTTVSVFATGCGALGDPVACNDNFCELASRVDFAVTEGAEYLIRVAGNNGDRGAYSMSVTNPPGALAGPFTNPADGHTFYLLQASSWPEAEADAVALGGHLTTIESAAENQWIVSNVLGFDGDVVFRRGWIGLQRDGIGQFSTWADGQGVTFTNWAAGEPNNAGGAEAYAEMIQTTGLWNDAREFPGSSNFGIVEIPTPPTNPLGVGSAAPATVVQGNTVLLTVGVTPAGAPASTGITVIADASTAGGSATLALLDDGVAPDVTAGDNVFSASLVTPELLSAGNYTLPVDIADAQGRSSDASIAFTVVDAVGGCCQPSGCAVMSRAACAGLSGTFLGHTIPCVTGDGYDISPATSAFEDISGSGNILTLTDDSNVQIPIGFTFAFYGEPWTDCFVGSNGFVTFGAGSNVFTNTAIPTAAAPNNAIYGFWDDLNPAAGGFVSYENRGTSGSDLRLIVQWSSVPQFTLADANTFQIVLFETGAIEFRYDSITAPVAGDVTVGVENAGGASGDSYDATQLGAGFTALSVTVRNATNNCGDTCRADLNGDGNLDPDDLADYIACYFLQPCAQADYNNDGNADPDDLSDYIAAYFAGCD